MFGHPHMFVCPMYVWISPICLDAPCMFGWMMFGSLLYIYNTNKACFVRLRGCPYAPIHLYAPYVWIPLYVWAPLSLDAPCMFGHSHMFGCPHMFGWLPICLDALHMSGCPLYVLMPDMFGHHPYVWMPPYVWTPPYFWMPPVSLDTPYVWMHPLYIWMPLYVLMYPCMFGCSPYV